MKRTMRYLLLASLSASLLLSACSGTASSTAASSAETQTSSLASTEVAESAESTAAGADSTDTAMTQSQADADGEHAEDADAHAAGAVHWSYSGDTGPAFWYSLAPEYAIAQEGKAQSPINIVTAECVSEAAPDMPVFSYEDTVFEVENNGHTIQMDPLSGTNQMEVDGVVYTLKQAHFHAPSEHQIDGKHMEMELHMVHQDADGNIAVLGLLITTGAENAVLKEAFEKLPAEVTPAGAFVKLDDTVNLGNLIADGTKIFRYDGSLTTPPCTEGVKWVICESVVELSKEQIEAFEAIYDGNNRPVQELNDRIIYN